MSLLNRFQEHLAASGLIPTGCRVLIGYSGGGDSTCLLHMCSRLGMDVVAAHLHHRQRAEGDSDAERCAAFAESLGVPFAGGQADVPSMSRDLGIGLEEAGRKARYEFFEQAARRTGCSRIATAHTLTDQAETVIHHLARGSGLTGLAGIPKERGIVARPLLPFSRMETLEYCREAGFELTDDASNHDLNFARARIRHRVVPELQKINPKAEEAIARTAAIVRSEDRFLNGMAAAALEQAEQRLNGDLYFLTNDIEMAFSFPVMAALPEVLFRRAVRLAVEALSASLDGRQVQTIVTGVQTEGRGAVTAEGGRVVIEWSSATLHIRSLLPADSYRLAVNLPGDTELPELGWRVTATRSGPSHEPPKRASLQTEVNEDAIRGPLYLRDPAPADSIQPLGFDGNRKISDLLGEARLTAAARARIPILCDLLGPVWIPGICLHERVRPASNAKSLLTLSFGPPS